ncbi:Uncharacterized protein OBRU01_26780, partial [Operophtera brumata]
RPSKASRRMPWGKGPKPKNSYKLKDIYERVLNKPASDAHRAENDCIFALEVSAALSEQFVEWVDENQVKWSEIKPMTIGYVVPWLVNQAGSLVYLLAVQRAPLSLAVPVANGLAFACTALAGALTGLEEPLHRGSVLGIALIVAGTALCCFDNTS